MTNPLVSIPETLRLAQQYHQAEQFQQAEQLYQQVLGIDPEHADANHLFGVLAYQLGHFDIAAQRISRAILRDGSQPPYYNNLGLVLHAQGNLDQAAMLYKQAISLDSNYGDACTNLGTVLESLGKLGEALSAYDQAIRINPEYSNAYNSRGVTLHKLGRLVEAISSLQLAIEMEPEFAEAHNNLGNSLSAQGKIGEALDAYRRALEFQPGNARAYSNLLLCMNYDDRVDSQALFLAHKQWNTLYGAELADRNIVYSNAPDQDRRLRIGYVSADFCRHSVASFIEPILEAHDRQAFEIFCYANVLTPDAVTARLQTLTNGWHNITGLTDAQIAEQIRNDAIDILVDLSGHTAGNRLLAFARKPAPIQVTYLGYPCSSGMSAMDYRLSDHWLDPTGSTDALHSEEVVRLPKGSLCFKPPGEISQGHRIENFIPGHVTFASFNNTAKISPDTVALWSRILQALPDSRLMLKSKSLGDTGAVERLNFLFNRHGIEPDRLEYISWTASMEDHLALYNRVHIGLDTFPYSGCTTTCEALWKNVPVLTLNNSESRSRMSLAILKQIGVDDLIADSVDDYVNKAVELAMDSRKLNLLRTKIQENLQHASLLDAGEITSSIERAYRQMWDRWCDKI